MIQLLNRIAWIVSLTFWITFVIMVWWYWEIWILWVFIGCIIKWWLLPKSYIESRVEHFSRISLKNKEDSYASVAKNISIESKKSGKDIWETGIPNMDSSPHEVKIHENNDREYKNNTEKKYSERLRESTNTFENILWQVKKFFSEDILAKIWGILVFLWVIFLLSLIWSSIPGVIKLLMGFIIWMSWYIAWVFLHKKWLPNEGKILLGTWLLINYAVILSGRYIIGGTSIDTDPLFSAGATFFFLILNTLFAVVTSLYYKSGVLLVFSLFVAYLNPLIVWWDSQTPYILIWYSLIISLWSLYLSVKEKSVSLLLMWFFLWNILLFIAPNSSWWEAWYMAQYISAIFLTLCSLMCGVYMNIKQKWIIEILFWASFFIVWYFGVFLEIEIQNINNYVLNTLSGLLFMWVAYRYMSSWPFLYTIWSIWWALVLWTNINWSNTDFLLVSILSVIAYAVLNIWSALLLKIRDTSSLKNLVLWSISGVLFLWFSLYSYGIEHLWQAWMGMWYFWLAIIYFWVSYFQVIRFWYETIQKEVLLQNTLYNFLAISVSLFNIAIILIFSDHSYVLALFWLFESAIVLFFFTKVHDIKVAIAWIIFMALGIGEFWNVSDSLILSKNYFYLLPCAFAFWAFAINTYHTRTLQNWLTKDIHDILHVWAIVILLFTIGAIFSKDLHTILAFALIFIWLWIFYKKYNSKILDFGFLTIFIFLLCIHIWEYTSSFLWAHWLSFQENIIHYCISIIFTIWAYLYAWSWVKKSQLILLVATCLYLFIITSLYIYQIFPNTFSITLYWWILAFTLLSQGISRDKIALRTLGLYLITLMCLKILFIDIGSAISDNIIKVVAFIAVWIMLIIISTMYSRKYGNNLKWEFDITNFFWWKKEEDISINKESKDIWNK